MRGFILIAHGRGVYRPGGGGYRACVRDGGRDPSPEERHWLCGGDPVWVGGLGIPKFTHSLLMLVGAAGVRSMS